MESLPLELHLGANFLNNGKVSFLVWAPRSRTVSIKIRKNNEACDSLVPMKAINDGFYYNEMEDVSEGDLYSYVLDNDKERPDPVSRYLPEGLHGRTALIDPKSFKWTDNDWKGIGIDEHIIYELHTGTFTSEGSFSSIIKKLPYLKDLGITCIELMPVAQFPGKRNWGYDGASLYAVQDSYGGPDGLKSLVNACHREGISVCLDVVYNHLGPEGNYLHDFGPYFTDEYHTPWGMAINYDGPDSGPVRNFIISNALYWITEYHIDALRLDAVHGIYDFGANHILQELKQEIINASLKIGRTVCVIAESDLNDSRIIRGTEVGGYGLDSQWSDDFHHCLHTVLTGENKGYYSDFGSIEDLAKSLQNAFVYDGMYSAFRKRKHGNSTAGLSPSSFVIASQNHDQIGNRAKGDRLSSGISFQQEKAAALLLLLSPYIPLIFMGQEYGETAPFQYFIDHGDMDLVKAVREGRKKEFASFGWNDIPDPDSVQTFKDSMLNWDLLSENDNEKNHKYLFRFYKDLIVLRKERLAGKIKKLTDFSVCYDTNKKWISLEYLKDFGIKLAYIVSLSDEEITIDFPFVDKKIEDKKRKSILIDSEDPVYGGSGKDETISGQIVLKPWQVKVLG